MQTPLAPASQNAVLASFMSHVPTLADAQCRLLQVSRVGRGEEADGRPAIRARGSSSPPVRSHGHTALHALIFPCRGDTAAIRCADALMVCSPLPQSILSPYSPPDCAVAHYSRLPRISVALCSTTRREMQLASQRELKSRQKHKHNKYSEPGTLALPGTLKVAHSSCTPQLSPELMYMCRRCA